MRDQSDDQEQPQQDQVTSPEPEPDTKHISTRALFLWWVVANVVGALVVWGIGNLANYPLSFLLGKQAPDSFSLGWSAANAVISLLNGLLLGTAQWLILRRRLTSLHLGAWASATAISRLASFFLSLLFYAALLSVFNTFVFDWTGFGHGSKRTGNQR